MVAGRAFAWSSMVAQPSPKSTGNPGAQRGPAAAVQKRWPWGGQAVVAAGRPKAPLARLGTHRNDLSFWPAFEDRALRRASCDMCVSLPVNTIQAHTTLRPWTHVSSRRTGVTCCAACAACVWGTRAVRGREKKTEREKGQATSTCLDCVSRHYTLSASRLVRANERLWAARALPQRPRRALLRLFRRCCGGRVRAQSMQPASDLAQGALGGLAPLMADRTAAF